MGKSHYIREITEMCYAEETEACEIRQPVIVTVVQGMVKESFVIKPMLRKEDLKRSKRVLQKNLNLALASQRTS